MATVRAVPSSQPPSNTVESRGPPRYYSVTPWRTPSDLLRVRQGLFPKYSIAHAQLPPASAEAHSSQPEAYGLNSTPARSRKRSRASSTTAARSEALAQLRAWSLRGNLPHAVRSTLLLFSALEFAESWAGRRGRDGGKRRRVDAAEPSASHASEGTTLLNARHDGGPDGHEDDSTAPAERDDDDEDPPHDTEADEHVASSESAHAHSEAADDFPARAALQTALAALVTGFADLGRTRTGGLGLSMASVAREIGLPAVFVEVRHEGVHEALPELRRLRVLAERAVKWLEGVYWARLDRVSGAGGVRGHADGEGTEETKGLLREWRRARVGRLQSGEAAGMEDEGLVLRLVKTMCDAQGAKGVVRGLCVKGMMIPSAKTAGEIEERIGSAYLIWDEFLQRLSRRSRRIMTALLAELLEVLLSTTEGMEQHGAKAWLCHILEDGGWARVLGTRRPVLARKTLYRLLGAAPSESSLIGSVVRALIASAASNEVDEARDLEQLAAHLLE